jgi:hypothetical protein
MKLMVSILVTALAVLTASCSVDDKNNGSNNSLRDINYNDESLGLKISHKISSNGKTLNIFYFQSKYKFCLKKNSLSYKHSDELIPEYGWYNNSTFSVDAENMKLSEHSSASYKVVHKYKSSDFIKLKDGYGSLKVDISEYLKFKNNAKIDDPKRDGYVLITIFPCYQLEQGVADPLVRAINYGIRLQ